LRRLSLPLVLLTLAVAGCNGASAPPPASLSEYCAIATRSGLTAWVGDVVTVCDGPPAAGDDHPVAPCSVFRVARGELTPIVLPEGVEAQLALPAFDGRLVVLTTDDRLLFGAPAGPLAEIAGWAAEPRVSEDGRHVAYAILADGFDEPELGVPTQLVLHDLGADRREVVSTDAEASAPFPIPGSRDLLYVSTRSGAASLYRASPGGEPTQLTNVGMERVEQGFVPVPARQLAWLGTGEAIFTAEYEDDRVWRLDLAASVAEELGPGAWPRANADGSVTARRTDGAECSVTYLDGRTP
jgi:hypothetical protein